MNHVTPSNAFEDRYATLGDRLVAAREAQGMSVAQLSKRLGVNSQTLVRWEDDRAEPRANRLQMLCGILNVSLMWLMTGQGDGGADVAEFDAKSEQPEVISDIIADLAALRVDQQLLAERAGRLEKRLRTVLSS